MTYHLGVDIEGTKIALAIIDDSGKIVAKIEKESNLPCPSELLEKNISQYCRELCSSYSITIKDIEWVGIGVPGSVNGKTGIIEFNANFGYTHWKLKEAMERLLECTTYIENDANAAAYGEYKVGALRGTNIGIMVTLGTGIGGGVIINGKLLTGCNSAGAELGHIVIEKNGRACKCGRRGCFEKYASSVALKNDTVTAMMANPKSLIWDIADRDINKVNAKLCYEAMQKGDETATQLIRRFEEYLACGLTNIINIFQPDVLCIGGGISAEGERLIAPVRKIIDREDYARNCPTRSKIVSAELRNNAGLIGAAMLGKQI